MKTINKSDLHFIGHLRGIDQYEIKGDFLALVLKLGDNYYLSYANSDEHYNINIAVRIHNFYSPLGEVADLGELIKVI